MQRLTTITKPISPPVVLARVKNHLILKAAKRGKELRMRAGLNSGPVVAGVIGFTKFSYDLWGSTVNTASRMESTAAPGTIQISAMTHELLQDNYIFSKNGLIQCKGLGEIEAYALVGMR